MSNNFSFQLKPVNSEGDPLSDGTGSRNGASPDDCIAVSGSGVTAYIKKPGQGMPYCFKIVGDDDCSPYDWDYSRVGEPPLHCFAWNSAISMYGCSGAWECNGLWASFMCDSQPSEVPTQINILIGYELASDPGNIIVWTEGAGWPAGYGTPLTIVRDANYDEIWRGTQGDNLIHWASENREVKYIEVMTGDSRISKIYASRIGFARYCEDLE